MPAVGDFLSKLSLNLQGGTDDFSAGALPEHTVLVEEARQEWLAARSLFNNICEQDLIDHAIFKLNAAERRYIFLLQEARALQNAQKNTKGGSPTREQS